MMRTERTRSTAGFSLIEMVVACGIFIVVIAFGITTTRAVGRSLNATSVVVGDTQFLDRLEEQLRSDAQSAQGLRASDTTGVEFATTDNVRQWRRWSYRLRSGGGLEITQDGATTLVDARVSRFDARFIPANELNREGATSELLRGLPTPDAYTMDLNGQQITNGVVRVDVQRGPVQRTI